MFRFLSSLWLLIVFVALTLAMSAAPDVPGQVPVPVRGSSKPPTAAEPQTVLPVFEFHSGFWVNLHHFLYEQGRLREQRPLFRSGTASTAPSASQRESSLTPSIGLTLDTALRDPAAAAAWGAALDYYASALAGRDLLFDGDMVAINRRLSELEAEPDLHTAGLRPELMVALERAAPVYRAHAWPEHDRANRAWVAAVTPLVQQLGALLAKQLAAVYHAQWPTGRIRVDVAVYGGPLGAYTSLDPLHVTISSTEPRNQGPAALEMLFHEASHGLAGAVRDGIARECRARNKPIPRDLWHALLFYTTGEIVKRAFSLSEIPAGHSPGQYMPYAYRYGLYARGWENYQRVLERHWQPYLDGKVDFDTALARLVADL